MFIFKSLFANKLHKIALKKQLKDWNRILNELKKQSCVSAKKGNFKLVITGEQLKCDYNKTRAQEDIVNDIRKSFTGCVVGYGTNATNQFIVEINWKKS